MPEFVARRKSPSFHRGAFIDGNNCAVVESNDSSFSSFHSFINNRGIALLCDCLNPNVFGLIDAQAV
jgi:hypothetical protein